MNVIENARVAAAIGRFAADHPEYSTPWGARDKCQDAAYRFMEYASAEGCEDCEVVEGLWIEDNIVLWGHSVVRIGDRVYDWTARQFYPPAAWPVVMTVADWEAFMMTGNGDGEPTQQSDPISDLPGAFIANEKRRTAEPIDGRSRFDHE